MEYEGGDPTDGDGQHQKKQPFGQVDLDFFFIDNTICNDHHNPKLGCLLTENGQPKNNLALHIKLAALPDVDGGKC